MTSVKLCVAEVTGLPASLTLTTMEKLPLTFEVPEMTSPLILMPSGSLPVWDHVYGVVPPRAARVVEYALPWVPEGSDFVRIVTGPLTLTHSFTALSVLEAYWVVPE